MKRGGEKIMNRIELIAVFKALEILGKEKNLDGILEIVKTVLDEAQSKPPQNSKNED